LAIRLAGDAARAFGLVDCGVADAEAARGLTRRGGQFRRGGDLPPRVMVITSKGPLPSGGGPSTCSARWSGRQVIICGVKNYAERWRKHGFRRRVLPGFTPHNSCSGKRPAAWPEACKEPKSPFLMPSGHRGRLGSSKNYVESQTAQMQRQPQGAACAPHNFWLRILSLMRSSA
jgi:hypothetical protein